MSNSSISCPPSTTYGRRTVSMPASQDQATEFRVEEEEIEREIVELMAMESTESDTIVPPQVVLETWADEGKGKDKGKGKADATSALWAMLMRAHAMYDNKGGRYRKNKRAQEQVTSPRKGQGRKKARQSSSPTDMPSIPDAKSTTTSSLSDHNDTLGMLVEAMEGLVGQLKWIVAEYKWNLALQQAHNKVVIVAAIRCQEEVLRHELNALTQAEVGTEQCRKEMESGDDKIYEEGASEEEDVCGSGPSHSCNRCVKARTAYTFQSASSSKSGEPNIPEKGKQHKSSAPTSTSTNAQQPSTRDAINVLITNINSIKFLIEHYTALQEADNRRQIDHQVRVQELLERLVEAMQEGTHKGDEDHWFFISAFLLTSKVKW
ncbi:hypothetical protein BS17DRAFT_821474 [Gyrodon lividus]|nr:hypothetical protein BS17DRAFT_821474 [Gyrodon lividus]